MSETDPFHYPAQVFNLLVDVIPLINKSKPDVLAFFRGAGVAERDMRDVSARVHVAPSSIRKHEIARTILNRLNEVGDRQLRQRREVVKRVVEFENFGACWPEDVLKAKGLISDLRRAVHAHDTFVRLDEEREREADKRRRELVDEEREREAYRREVSAIAKDLGALFGMDNPQARGKALESVLNRLFALKGILVREGFTNQGAHGEGVVEQIDGVIEFDAHAYLVEMKWHKEALGIAEIAQPLVRVFGRGDVRGLVISASGFSPAAVAECDRALSQKVITLCHLREIVHLLETQGDLLQFLRSKVHVAEFDRRSLHEVYPR